MNIYVYYVCLYFNVWKKTAVHEILAECVYFNLRCMYFFSTTEIDQFLLTRRDGIHVDKSIVTKRSELGSRVQSITLNWTPKRNEAGKHLVCSFVIDTLGYE